MRSRIRSFVGRFLYMLDTEGVELFQWLFYLILAFDGAQNLFIAHNLPLTLQGTMDPEFFRFWCGLEMVAPSCCLAGRYLSRNTTYASQADVFQMVGDLVLGSSEVAYVIATFHLEPVGKGGHGGYLGLSFMISAYLLALRDFRRARARKHIAKHSQDFYVRAVTEFLGEET